jgi:DNA polymerase-3 subunit beta
MKATFDREALLNSFQTAAAVAPSRSPKPILQNVKLEAARDGALLLATDLEIGMRVDVAGGHVDVAGSAILPIQRFGSILRESTDAQLRLESDGQTTLVRGERSEFRLQAEDPSQFPAVAAFEETAYHELPGRVLRQLVRRTVFATDNESSRYALGGVLVELTAERIIAVGTDGRRLAKMEAPAQGVGGHQTGDQTTIVPSRAMQLIERSLTDDEEVRLAVRANDVLVRSSRVTILTRLVEGRFPRWRDVFPSRAGTRKIELVSGPFFAAVRQAAIITSEDSRGVDFSFADGKLVLSGRSAQVGQARVEFPVAYDGNPVSITLDPRYLAEFLRVLDPETVITFDLKDSDSAALCTTADGYGYVVMPLARER